MLIFSFFFIMQGFINIKLMQVASFFGFVYMTWAVGNFFGKKKIINYVKALFAYILGMLTFFIIAILSGSLIDLLAKP